MIRARLLALIAVIAALALASFQDLVWDFRPSQPEPLVVDSAEARAARLGVPAEAIHTLDLVIAGGPFPYRQDGGVFENRERRLPDRPMGYYRRFTVETPGSSTRGPRRLVTGGDPPHVFYYTADHYRSFQQLEITPRGTIP